MVPAHVACCCDESSVGDCDSGNDNAVFHKLAYNFVAVNEIVWVRNVRSCTSVMACDLRQKRVSESERTGVERNIDEPAVLVWDNCRAAFPFFADPWMTAFVWRRFEQRILSVVLSMRDRSVVLLVKPGIEFSVAGFLLFDEKIVLELYAQALDVFACGFYASVECGHVAQWFRVPFPLCPKLQVAELEMSLAPESAEQCLADLKLCEMLWV